MYELEAILARKETIEGALDDFQQARIIRLPQDHYDSNGWQIIAGA
jgi:hypothetical protein